MDVNKKDGVNERKVVFTITQKDGDRLSVNVGFNPPISGPNSDEYKALSPEQKALNNYAAYVASLFMEAVKDANGVPQNVTAQ